MQASKYLKRQLDMALAMLEQDMIHLDIPKVTKSSQLIHRDATQTNSYLLITSIMQLVLFEKNRESLARSYPDAKLDEQPIDTLAEFDGVDLRQISVSLFGAGMVNIPTLTTEYGDILLTIPSELVLSIYDSMPKTVDLRVAVANEEGDTLTDNVVRPEFGKKK